MFAGEPNAADRAQKISTTLANHREHRHHGRRLSARYLKNLGLKIIPLEQDPTLQELVLTAHHCLLHTFAMMPALVKLVESHEGRMFPTLNVRLLRPTA